MTDYTSPEFWANAPEGATHWEHGGRYADVWMKLDHLGWWYWGTNTKDWEWSCLSHHMAQERVDAMTPRPAPWDGTGLPPVGTICRVSLPHQHPHIPVKDGAEVTILAHDGDLAIFRVNNWEGEGALYHGLVRRSLVPVPTAEQIAAEERKRAIGAMQRIVSNGDPLYGRKVCEALYDAGYRKVAQEDAQ